MSALEESTKDLPDVRMNLNRTLDMKREVDGHTKTLYGRGELPGVVSDIRSLNDWRSNVRWTNRLLVANMLTIIGGVILFLLTK